MQVRLCDTIASVERDGEASRSLTQQSALLLRLLSLWPDQRVSLDLAAHVLNIAHVSVSQYVKVLRLELGDIEKTLIVSRRGLRASVVTDAPRFRELTECALNEAGERDFATLDPDDARDIARILDEALAIWKGSPATGLDRAPLRQPNPRKVRDVDAVRTAFVTLESVFDEWVDLRTDALLLRADCLLAGGRAGRDAKQVVRSLMPLANREVPDERVWLKLLTAITRLGDHNRQRDVWGLALRSYTAVGDDVPDDVRAFAPAEPPRPSHLEPGHNAAVRPAALSNEEATVLNLTSLLGVTSTSALQLRGSRLEPIECIERADHTLYFSGVLAGKWVGDRPTFRQFQMMLQRFQARVPQGEVRFLVVHPGSTAYQRLAQMRAGEANYRSVNTLIRLSQKYPCLKVSGMEHLPSFRVIVIDEDIVSFSPYDLENEAVETSRQGWAAPHVVLDPFAPFPLAPAFRSHFTTEWNSAVPMREEFL